MVDTLDLKQYQKETDQAKYILVKHLAKLKFGNQPIAIIISGGVDSSSLYALSRSVIKNLKPFSLISQNSQDKPFLDIIQNHYGQTIETIDLDKINDDVLAAKLRFYKPRLKSLNLPVFSDQLSLIVGFDILFEQIAKQNIKYVITAQGPDILLAGYFRYHKVANSDLIDKIKADLISLEIDKKRDGLAASSHDIELINPYLSQEFIDFCLNLPTRLIRNQNQSKYLIRLIAASLNLPESIVNRPKKAFQYSTKIDKRIKKIIKDKDL